MNNSTNIFGYLFDSSSYMASIAEPEFDIHNTLLSDDEEEADPSGFFGKLPRSKRPRHDVCITAVFSNLDINSTLLPENIKPAQVFDTQTFMNDT